MKLTLLTGILFLNFYATSVAAKSISYKESRFSVDVPKNWREVKDLYGIPVTLLGPSVSPKPRAVVQIIPTPLPHGEMKKEDAKKFGEDYAEGRKRWLKEQGGELLELLPGSYQENRLMAGVSYKLNQKRYLERTYYVNCPKQLYHLKIVLNFENLDSLKESEEIVRSFACQ